MLGPTLKKLGYKSVQIHFDGSDKLPVQQISYLLMRITREWNIPFKVSKDENEEVPKDVLKLVIIDSLEKYDFYTSVEKINADEARRTLLMMFVDASNLNMINSISKIDCVLTEPFVTSVIQQNIEICITNKERRLVDYRAQYRAKQSIDMGMYESAQQILEEIQKRSPNHMTTISYLSEVYQHLGRYEDSISIVQEGLKTSPDNYYLLRRMFILLLSGDSYFHAFNTLNKLFNNFLVDGELLKIASIAAIEIGQYTGVESILEYVFSQDEEYIKTHKRFIEVSLYIYLKHLVITNQEKLFSDYCAILVKESSNYDCLLKLVDTSIKNENNCMKSMITIFHKNEFTRKYALYADLMSKVDTLTSAQIINKSKELVDFECLRLPSIYDLLLKKLKDVANKTEYDKYEKQYNKIK